MERISSYEYCSIRTQYVVWNIYQFTAPPVIITRWNHPTCLPGLSIYVLTNTFQTHLTTTKHLMLTYCLTMHSLSGTWTSHQDLSKLYSNLIHGILLKSMLPLVLVFLQPNSLRMIFLHANMARKTPITQGLLLTHSRNRSKRDPLTFQSLEI